MPSDRLPLRHRIFAHPMVRTSMTWIFRGIIKIVTALPSHWILATGDGVGSALSVLDRRAWHIARVNMRTVLGESLPENEAKRIHKASYRQATRAVALLLHLQPLTKKSFLDWVELPADASEGATVEALRARGGVLVSGHVGNWELLLGMRTAFEDFPPTVFLAEPSTHPALNVIMEELRSHADLVNVFRKGGAAAVAKVVRRGGIAALLVDRNVRKKYGGIYSPFLSHPSRTTPLPAWLAVHTRVPLLPVFCFPKPNGRYRVWIGPDLNQGLTSDVPSEMVLELTTRINDVLSDVIRAQPELWNWRMKRFKSRPHPELKTYPAYSSFDPEHA